MANIKILVNVPEALLQHADAQARAEHRTRSELVREALRQYVGHTAPPALRVVETTPPPSTPKPTEWKTTVTPEYVDFTPEHNTAPLRPSTKSLLG